MPSHLARRSQRKKQTRLAFDPVEPSSSTTMSPARIRYEASSPPDKAFDLTSSSGAVKDIENGLFPSGKKYAVIVETPKKHRNNGKISFQPLATPAESSQPQGKSRNPAEPPNKDHSDSDIGIASTSRLQHANGLVTLSSPRISSPLLNSTTSIRRPLTGTDIFSPGSKQRRRMFYRGMEDDSSAGSSPEEEMQATSFRAIKAKAKRRSRTSEPITLGDNENGAESPLESPSRAKVTRGRAVIPRNDISEDTDKSKSADMRSLISGGALNFSQKSKRSSRNQDERHAGKNFESPSRNSARANKNSSIQSDEDDDIAILPVVKRTERHGNYKKQIVITDNSEDPDATCERSQRRPGKLLNSTDEDHTEDELPSLSQINGFSNPKRRSVRIFDNDDEAEEEEDGNVERSSAERRFQKGAVLHNGEKDTDEDDEDLVSSPFKRRRLVVEEDPESDAIVSPSKRFRSKPIEQKDTTSDLDGPPKRITRQRRQKKPHRSERDKKLELLKRQRAGEKLTELTSSESDAEEGRHGIYDSNSELEVLSEFEDEEKDDEEGIEEVRRSLLAPNQNDVDDDFIVDDDDVPLGVPEHNLNDIPLEFTHHAHKPLKEHFKDVVEWMIQNKVNPAFNRRDPVYTQAFRKLDTEVQGYAASIYSSSVWKEAFTRALWARPVFMESTISPGHDHEGTKCDACGRTNHPATFELQFTGKAYNKDTLDEIDNDHGDGETDDDEDSSSTTSVNSKGQEIPGTDISWYVGRFCKANAQTAHSLIHWKHALNEWVIDRLKSEGILAASKLAQREDWSMIRRNKYAIRIVDEWEQAGEIKSLYRDFKINLDVARQGKQSRWSK